MVKREDLRLPVRQLLKSRKNDQTRSYCHLILDYLTKSMESETDPREGYVRTQDLVAALTGPGEGLRIPRSTLFKMLKDLERYHLIKRQPGRRIKSKAGRPPVYYRVPLAYPSIWFITREELEKDDEKAWQTVGRAYRERNVAIALLQKHGVKDPEAEIQKMIDEVDTQFQETLMDLINRDEIDIIRAVDGREDVFERFFFTRYPPHPRD